MLLALLLDDRCMEGEHGVQAKVALQTIPSCQPGFKYVPLMVMVVSFILP